jgi:hypothetical protein
MVAQQAPIGGIVHQERAIHPNISPLFRTWAAKRGFAKQVFGHANLDYSASGTDAPRAGSRSTDVAVIYYK